MKKIQKNKVTRLHPVICTLSLFAFIATAAVATLAVSQASNEVEGRVIANTNQVPKSWDTTSSLSATADLDVDVLANNYVQYTATITNSDSSAVYVTHLASYLSNADSEGFIPLGDHNIEYTYTPDDATTWHELNITAPANSDQAFALANQLYLTPNNKVYLRYYVSPESTVTNLNDKLAVLLADSNGQVGYAEDITSINYANTIANLDTVNAKNDDVVTNNSGVDETYAEPLGVFSFAPSIAASSSTVAKAGPISGTFIKNAVKAAITFLLAIAICAITYFFFRQPKRVHAAPTKSRRKTRK